MVYDCYVHDICFAGANDSNGGGGVVLGGGFWDNTDLRLKFSKIETIANVTATGATTNSQRFHGIYLQSWDSEIVGNISIDSRGTTQGDAFISWHDNDHCLIAHNTLLSSDGGGLVIGGGDNTVGGGWNNRPIAGHYIINNLVYDNAYGISVQSDGVATVGASTFVNNITSGNSGGNLNIALGGSTATGTITTLPSFIDYESDGSGNYHPGDGSNADATGATLPVVNSTPYVALPWRDFDGNPRSGRLTSVH